MVRSTLAKSVIIKIIADGSNNQQIIMYDQHVNEVKYVALQLYCSIWPYYAEEPMFRLCLSTLLTRPQVLLDDMEGIMERVVVILERSISQEVYYSMFHNNLQTIVLCLLDLLKPKESTIAMCASDPDEYVEMLDDFCMSQQREMLDTKVISLISSLCLYIDGYMSFISSLCIMLLK